MTTPSRAVFLSYASEDAPAAQRIADALRAAGIDVWFDQSELAGGDAWDRQIRKQIHDCALFVPVISAHSDARHEGYFRREWRLAVERAGDMSERVAFLVPVVIDDTRESGADVPDRFREVQWTRLPEGAASAPFIERVRRLLLPEAAQATSGTPTLGTMPQGIPTTGAHRKRLRSRAWILAAAVLIAVPVAYFAFERLAPKHAVPSAVAPVGASSAVADGFNPPPHSIAVLPFVNMSADKDQEYFSDGLTEEILNSLSRISELQVAGRTSSFYFKGKDVDLGTVARKLNVAAVLEGSVRRSGHTARVTTQLINTATGFHLWSETYDRDLGDVLKLETEIANAVAGALQVTLLEDVAAMIELGDTHNPAARDAYLKATKLHFATHTRDDELAAIASFSEAVRLDPNYALAFAGRALSLNAYSAWFIGGARRDVLDKARADAREAIARAPAMAEGHLALATNLEDSLDFAPAKTAYQRALTLAPGSARVLRDYGVFAVNMGWTGAGLAALRRALMLDPLNRNAHRFLGDALGNLRRYEEAIAAYREALAIDPDDSSNYDNIGVNYYELGDFDNARSWCEAKSAGEFSLACRAFIYHKLGRHADAEAVLAKFRTESGDIYPYVNALVYAQWGDTAKALEWLDKAMRARDRGIKQLKIDPMLDQVRQEPRFQAIERELNFPN